jgi:hypothetical protein
VEAYYSAKVPIEGLKHHLDANDRLILIRVKIERAKKHLADLEADVRKFRHERLNVVGTHTDPKTRAVAYFHADLPVLSFNALAAAGDIVHNLRSSFDHLAGQLVIVGSGNEPTRRVEFPIAKDFATYEAEKARKVEGMTELAIKYIDNLKPYKGGNQLLWRIHELDNIDKHRTLFTVAKDYLFIDDWMPMIGSPYWLKTGDPHFAGVFDPEVEKDAQLEIEKAFGKAKVTQSDALLPSMQDLISFTEETTFSFKPLLE